MAEDVVALRSLFEDAFPDEWRGDSNFSRYIGELCAYSLERLNGEPDRLSEEKSRLLNETRKLAFDNYKAFIQTADCTKEIFHDFISVERNVQGLLGKLPKFVESCRSFQSESQDISQRRKRTSLMLSRHTQLLEILEIPQVMDTCVRNGYHDEALELSAYVKRLEKKHGDIPIIKSIASEVDGSMKLMLSQLLQQLKSNIQLPTCLKVIGYLRRMNVFTEVELRHQFLQARDTWFKTALSGIPTQDGYQHIMKTIDLTRVHLFDIITQYKAVFPDDELSSASVLHKDQHHLTEGGIFHSWVNQKIWEFLHCLEADLAKGESSRLDSVLNQCMYFGLSFSRIGADFRPLLIPILNNSILKSFQANTRNAKQEFISAMKKFTLLSMPSATAPSYTVPPSSTSEVHAPPTAIMDYPALAHFTNSLVASFNDLRLCIPTSLAISVTQEVTQAVRALADSIVEFYNFDHETFSDKEKVLFSRCVDIFCNVFCPWVKSSLDLLFPASSVSSLAACTPYAVQYCKSLSSSHTTSNVLDVASKSVQLELPFDVEEFSKDLKLLCPEVFQKVTVSEAVK